MRGAAQYRAWRLVDDSTGLATIDAEAPRERTDRITVTDDQFESLARFIDRVDTGSRSLPLGTITDTMEDARL